MSKKRKQGPSAARTPQAVLDAFFPEVIRIGGIEIGPCSLAHFLALERINSPVLSNLSGATFEDCARAVMLLGMSDSKAMRLAARPAELEDALVDFCRRVPGGEIRMLADKVVSALNASFATAIPSKSGSEALDTDPLGKGPQPTPPPSAGA